MVCRVAVLASVLALAAVPCTSGSSEHVPEDVSASINKLQAQNDGIHQNSARYRPETRMSWSRGAGNYIDLIATSSVLLATLFLLLRCAAYVYKVSRLRRLKRRLAEGDSCGDVRALFISWLSLFARNFRLVLLGLQSQ